VPDLQYAAYQTMDNDYGALRDAMWNGEQWLHGLRMGVVNLSGDYNYHMCATVPTAETSRETLVARFKADLEAQASNTRKESRVPAQC
jgi:hypothetical protein